MEIFHEEAKESLLRYVAVHQEKLTPITIRDMLQLNFDAKSQYHPVLAIIAHKPIQTVHNTYYEQLMKIESYIVKKTNKRKNILNVGCNNNQFFVETDPEYEAVLFKHFTKPNKDYKMYAKYICKYYDFVEDNNYYYLIMEDENYIGLNDWLKQAFLYISSGQLNVTHYRKIIKYMFWQITLVINWLHNTHLISHLSIKIHNFMIVNGAFTSNNGGSVTIPTNIQIKLCSLSTAQIFETKTTLYKKTTKIDVYQLGNLLYLLTFGELPVQNVINSNKLQQYIHRQKLCKLVTIQMYQLIVSMLCYDENKRLNLLEIMKCKWFSSYWKKYKMHLIR